MRPIQAKNCSRPQFPSDGDGGGGGDGDDVPTTLPSGQSPGPSRPGTKYPVRGQCLTSMVSPEKRGKIEFSIFPISWKYWKYVFLLILGIFTKKTRAEISRRMHRSMGRDLSYENDSVPKTKTVADLNFELTPATASATRRQLSHLASPLDHHAQGPNIPFGVNPSLRLGSAS